MINCSESDFFNIISDNVKLPNFAKKNKNKDFALFGEANYRTKTIKIYDNAYANFIIYPHCKVIYRFEENITTFDIKIVISFWDMFSPFIATAFCILLGYLISKDLLLSIIGCLSGLIIVFLFNLGHKHKRTVLMRKIDKVFNKSGFDYSFVEKYNNKYL